MESDVIDSLFHYAHLYNEGSNRSQATTLDKPEDIGHLERVPVAKANIAEVDDANQDTV